jgi:hypothetical protein
VPASARQVARARDDHDIGDAVEFPQISRGDVVFLDGGGFVIDEGHDLLVPAGAAEISGRVPDIARCRPPRNRVCAFIAAHDLPDVTVVADAGMVNEANQKAAGQSFILRASI